MLTYQEAHELMSKARNGRRKLANNTYLEERRRPALGAAFDGCYQFADGKSSVALEMHYAVRLHATDVVTLHPDGSQTLNSGGWRTVTTKDRINAYSASRVWSERGEWYVEPRRPLSLDECWNTDPESGIQTPRRYSFADGMTIHPNGTVTA